MIHREHILQRAVVLFCKRCIAVPFKLAAHDRAAARSAYDHIWQAERGIPRDWPDIELALAAGRTLRVELKEPRVKLKEGSGQAALIGELNELGHPSGWANTVMRFAQVCERFDVELRPNWREVAKLLDEHVAGEIRTEEARAKPLAPKSAALKLRPPRRGRPSVAAVRRFEANRNLP